MKKELSRKKKIKVLECAISILEKGKSFFMCVAIDKATTINKYAIKKK